MSKEIEAYKVFQPDWNKDSPTWGNLFSTVKRTGWHLCYGSKAGTKTEHPHIFIFEFEDWADEWVCNHWPEPEAEMLQIWKIVAHNPQPAPIALPEQDWQAFWDGWDNNSLNAYIDHYGLESLRDNEFWGRRMMTCSAVTLVKCVKDYWLEDREELDRLAKEEEEEEEA